MTPPIPDVAPPLPDVDPPLSRAPSPNSHLDDLVQCTDKLGDVKKEVKKIIRLFKAISTLGRNIVTVHVKNFKVAGDCLVSCGLTGDANQVERKDLLKHARSVKAYFCVIRAVASMYNLIHPGYIAKGIDLLVELSISKSDEERIRREHSLAASSHTLSTELADYIETKKRLILRDIRSEVDEIVGGV